MPAAQPLSRSTLLLVLLSLSAPFAAAFSPSATQLLRPSAHSSVEKYQGQKCRGGVVCLSSRQNFDQKDVRQELIEEVNAMEKEENYDRGSFSSRLGSMDISLDDYLLDPFRSFKSREKVLKESRGLLDNLSQSLMLQFAYMAGCLVLCLGMRMLLLPLIPPQ